MKILVTGGAGYIGSHTVAELLQKGYDTTIVDNLSNSSEKAVERVREITGKTPAFYEADIRDADALRAIFAAEQPDAVIHFAGLKAVGESVKKPLLYYDNNIAGTLVLLEVMEEYQVKNLVFSSSATVYGIPKEVPISETAETFAINPYGRTKLMIEKILRDLYAADSSWNIALLRYFNPIGAHESGLIGEDPKDIPNNLLPYVAQVAVGKLEKVHVFGNDYDTPDGTGVRDYIHVVDLAKGHLNALDKILQGSGIVTYNLGTGNGYSVLEVIEAFREASGSEIPYEINDRRPGDAATCYADASLAEKELGWKAEYDLKRMCADSWRWQSRNPNGYEDETCRQQAIDDE